MFCITVLIYSVVANSCLFAYQYGSGFITRILSTLHIIRGQKLQVTWSLVSTGRCLSWNFEFTDNLSWNASCVLRKFVRKTCFFLFFHVKIPLARIIQRTHYILYRGPHNKSLRLYVCIYRAKKCVRAPSLFNAQSVHTANPVTVTNQFCPE